MKGTMYIHCGIVRAASEAHKIEIKIMIIQQVVV